MASHAKYAEIQAQMVLTRKTISILGDIKHTSFFRIFDVKINPLLLYGARNLGINHFGHIEKVHLFAYKTFLCVKTNTPSIMIYGELGRHPLYIAKYLKDIKYWLSLIDMLSYRNIDVHVE